MSTHRVRIDGKRFVLCVDDRVDAARYILLDANVPGATFVVSRGLIDAQVDPRGIRVIPDHGELPRVHERAIVSIWSDVRSRRLRLRDLE